MTDQEILDKYINLESSWKDVMEMITNIKKCLI